MLFRIIKNIKNRIRVNSEKDAVHEDQLKIYFDINNLVKKLSAIFSKKSRQIRGHIHFYFQDKTDHIILAWSKGKVKQIIAKSPHCKKGEYVKWGSSQFCDYKPEDVLGKLYDKIKDIRIDDGNFRKTWPSYAKFIKWLTES